MPDDLIPSHSVFVDLTQFANLLPPRTPMIGEVPGLFDGFHQGLLQALAPRTQYESVIAENLIALEWELIQHRHMRDAAVGSLIRDAVMKAVYNRCHSLICNELLEAFEAHEAAGGTEEDWKDPFRLDTDAAEALGRELAAKAVSKDASEFAAAKEEIENLGLDLVELMGAAYRSDSIEVRFHEEKLKELERRRHEVKRDFDACKKSGL